ncbi:hypothetical protein BGX34_011218 [Mortierella sp. NVP85]|nr:hypothetical protein BGX34_011218 [Mortierella sp. NVP85]
MFHERSSEAARRYFAFEKSHVPGAAVSLWGSPYKKKSSNTHLKPALIPDGTPTFEFNTFFRGWQAGHYVVRWRVKLKGNFSVPGGLHFRVDVNYGAEEDATSSLDVVMPHDELKKPDSLDNECTYDLELEDLVVVQPQLNRGGAMVVVAMSNFGSVNDAHAGLQVEYVELSPFSGFNQSGKHWQTVCGDCNPE